MRDSLPTKGSFFFLTALLLPALCSPALASPRCVRPIPTRHIGAGGSPPVPQPSLCRDTGGFQVSSPSIEGPVTGGKGGPFLAATSFPLASVGYEQEEFFLSGNASRFTNIGPLGSDGHWSVAVADTAPYKTRIVVYRPSDPAKFDGTVLVEWLNVSGGLDSAPDWISAHVQMVREGMAWVGVSAQFVGVEGGPAILGQGSTGLKMADPARYGSLVHPGDSYSYDIFSQAGEAVRDPHGPDPLGGLRVKRVIAIGESQSAFRLTTYVDAFDPIARVFDGYLIHSRGSSGADLSQSPEPGISPAPVVRIRDDVRVPVLTFETETDLLLLGYLPDRQADAAHFRLWEVAGTAHADTYTLQVGFDDVGDSPDVAAIVVTSDPIPGVIECGSPINSGPQHFVLDSAVSALVRWVRLGLPPPHAPRLETVPGPVPAYALDEHGNVKGGIRTAHVDAPIATLSGLGQTGGAFCAIFGTTKPFDAATLAALYPAHQDYVSAVAAATDSAHAAGFVNAADADLIKQQAGTATVPQ
jgi:hypothetical protein